LKRLEGWRNEAYHYLNGRIPYSLFELSELRLKSLANLARRFNVRGMVAYTGAAVDLARLVEQSETSFPALAATVVGAEKLHLEQRSYIESVLDTVVFETYGSREFMLLAAECPEEHRLHLTAENHIVEILGDDGDPVEPGTIGQVVVTDLTNHGFPFIRYRNGDTAALSKEPCKCGRGLPILESVSGRVTDTITTSSGLRISGLLFPHYLRDASGIIRYQAEEIGDDHIELRVVASSSFNESQINPLRTALAALDHGQIRLSCRVVDHIPPGQNGKYMTVVARRTETA